MICCLVSDAVPKPGALAEVARACSPRVESHGDRVVVFDAGGLERVIGPPAHIAREVGALAVEQGFIVRIALAPTMAAAWLMAHAQIGQTVVDPPRLASMLGALPLASLATLPGAHGPKKRARADALDAFARWGLKTLAQVARLPRADVHARLGDEGVRLHMAACGEDASPLVPAGAAPEFIERMVLEWPIEGLEPLSFVLSRLCDALSVSLERAERGAVTVTTRLKLVDRTAHVRTLTLPAPMRDAKVLRTLITLDLESHPPPAGIDDVAVEADVVPGRIVQGSLLDRALPAPEAIATLTARLGALMGDGRVGAPVVLDTHDERTIGLRTFVIGASGHRAIGSSEHRGIGSSDHRDIGSSGSSDGPMSRCPDVPMILRRFRLPISARVIVERGGPVRVVPASSAIPAGNVIHRAGPWRSSGRWWTTDKSKWDRDEWDVELAGAGCYRIARVRESGLWEIEGEID